MSDIVITTSWDDGHPLDHKLAKLLSKFQMPGTFYIPCKMKEKKLMPKDEIKLLSKQFEIGSHTLNHTILTELSQEEMYNEILRGKELMEEICGKITSFAYVGGQYNDSVIEAVKKAGFRGARTAEFLRYRIRDPYEHHPTVHAYNRILASRWKQIVTSEDKGLAFSTFSSGTIFRSWKDLAKKTLDYVFEHGGIWHIWGHSWELDENNDWENLEDVLLYAHNKGKQHGAEFLSNGEIFEKASKMLK